MKTEWSGRVAMVACLFIACGFITGCASEESSDEMEEQVWTLDSRSKSQGAIGAMSEMVDYGVKRLALSAALPPGEMDEVMDDAIEIATRHNVEVYRETDFLVTDLFSAELTDGKHVLFICHPSTYQEYLKLKADKQLLVESDRYVGEARTEIARRFGRLLSYPDSTITRHLSD